MTQLSVVQCDGCSVVKLPEDTTSWEKDDLDNDFCDECMAAMNDAQSVPDLEAVTKFNEMASKELNEIADKINAVRELSEEDNEF